MARAAPELYVRMVGTSTDILIKFGERPYMERLLQRGELFLNTLAFYRAGEIGAERLDQNEGLERMLQMAGSRLNKTNPDTGVPEELAMLTGGIGRVTNSNLDKINVYCLFHHALPDEENVSLRHLVDERVWSGFGNTAVIIGDAAAFLTRVKNAAKERGLGHWRRKVVYADLETLNGEVGPFLKDFEYAHQNELRIAVFDLLSEGSPLTLTIGDISDLAYMLPASEVPSLAVTATSCVGP